MFSIREVAYFGFEVTDLPRARVFYENMLGLRPALTFGTTEKGWVEYSIGALTFVISNNNTPEDAPPPSLGPCLALEVADFDAAVAHLRQNGVNFFGEPAESPLCWIADVFDPDGKRICIHQMKAARGGPPKSNVGR